MFYVNPVSVVSPDKGDFNVIAVSWPNGARQILNKAVATAFLVSAQVEKFIRYLNVRHNTLDLAKIHLIGHSIGAQISGNVGSRLHGEIGRITGENISLFLLISSATLLLDL